MAVDSLERAIRLAELEERREDLYFIFNLFFVPKSRIKYAKEMGEDEIAERMERERVRKIAKNPELYRWFEREITSIEDELRNLWADA